MCTLESWLCYTRIFTSIEHQIRKWHPVNGCTMGSCWEVVKVIVRGSCLNTGCCGVSSLWGWMGLQMKDENCNRSVCIVELWSWVRLWVSDWTKHSISAWNWYQQVAQHWSKSDEPGAFIGRKKSVCLSSLRMIGTSVYLFRAPFSIMKGFASYGALHRSYAMCQDRRVHS